jgi:hypothetical protein
MLGWVALIALGMFAWQAWNVSGDPQRAQHAKSLNDVDFTVEDDRPSRLKDDEVRIVPRRPRIADDPDADSRSLTINPAWLENVDDKTVGIRHVEAEAYYRILARAASIPASELRAAAVPHVYYANLMSSPDEFRGRPITLVGELRRLRQIPVPKNVTGLDVLYEAWICTSDSGENPYRVVCSEIPAELKPQESARVTVKVTGYFFKREGYQTQDLRLHVAPTLLAGKLSLYVSPNSPPPVEDVVPWMIGVISVIGLVMLATVIGFAVSDARGRNRTFSPMHVALDTAALFHADHRPSIEESLRRLEAVADEAESANESWQSNGESHHANESPAEEVVDLPTPFPPTRVPPRRNDVS